jgi:hypothetical protein
LYTLPPDPSLRHDAAAAELLRTQAALAEMATARAEVAEELEQVTTRAVVL